MPPTNDFVPFCNENTGTNLPTQSAYLANPNLPIGNQPGIASSSLNNKAIRQASTIAAILAQFTANTVGTDMLDNQNTADHAIPAALLAALTGALKRHSPVVTSYLSSSGNHNVTYKFQIATGSATAAATYSDGTTTYTVKTTVASGTQLDASGGAVPAAVSGTLTKTGGTGDATITYYAYRAPLFLKVTAIGPGGGGGGSGTGSSGGNATAGSAATTFGTGGSQISAGAGGAGLGGRSTGVSGGAGGTSSLGAGNSGVAYTGARGGFGSGATIGTVETSGGEGAGSIFNGGAPTAGGQGTDAVANSGGGGSGSGNATNNAVLCGSGGGSGGAVIAVITSPASVYAYVVGAAGGVGSAGTTGTPGGAGSAGIIIVEEHYQ